MVDTNDIQDLCLYLDAVYDGQEGKLHFAIGGQPYQTEEGRYSHRKWVPGFFHWPDDSTEIAGEMVKAAKVGDLFLCPYLMTGESRAKGRSLARALVHAEIDTEIDTDCVLSLNGFAVASGTTGHAHIYIYVPLTESVPVHQHEQLCRVLGERFGAKDFKVADNDVLRPPGSLNHKATVMNGGGGEPTQVRWLVRP
ncbi:hypothetical protein OG921_13015 [Aldersonia sp. NBC_00410]|uniref:hypothetical protein n=1 Tax=Aldersonia sp. NBC_00410 TaxID=2975954 RepID=UPI0022552355|nr:hypothetical protein [Aldersonia sp. NBC_00410]MCX5044086.1 hypothetical protein [Aldersonia sp. NBC_00410]